MVKDDKEEEVGRLASSRKKTSIYWNFEEEVQGPTQSF